MARRRYGITFCGKSGQATEEVGLLTEVDCSGCRTAAREEDSRFPRDRHVALKIGTGKTVHGGVIYDAETVLHALRNLEKDARRAMINFERLGQICELIAAEMAELTPPEEEA